MRKLNGKLFLGLLIAAALCTGTVFGVHHFQYQRIAQSLLWQAQHAADQGQVDRQARYLAHYLELNPRDDAEKAHLARLWAGDAFAAFPKTRQRAVRMIDDVLTRSDDQPELRRTLVRLALELNVLDLARGHLEKLLPWKDVQKEMAQAVDEGVKADPERGELEGFWGQLLERENKQPADAARCYELAVGHAPEGITSYVRRAYLLRRLDVGPKQRDINERDANQLMDKLVEKNPLSYQAYLAHWQYHREFGLISLSKDQPGGRLSLAKAGEDIREALQRAPEDVAVLLAAADRERLEVHVVESSRELTAAKREALIKEHSSKAYDYLEHGLTLLNKARAVNDNLRFQLLWHKGNLLLDELRRNEARLAEGNLSAAETEHLQARETEAAQSIEEIRKTRGLPASADYLRARLLVHQRHWAEATPLLEQVRPVLSGQPELASDINLYLARCYKQLEEPGRALEAYRRMARADQRYGTALSELGMAQAEWEMGQLDEAARHFQGLIDRGQLPDQVWADVARLQLQRQAQEDRPDWGVVEQALKVCEKVLPTSMDVPLLRAQMYLLRKQPARAEQVLQEAARKPHWARTVEIRTALVALALQQQQPNLKKAAALLDQAEKDLGDNVTLRLARVRFLVVAKGKAAIKGLHGMAANLDKLSEQDQGRLLSGLASALLSLEDISGGRELCLQLAQLPSHRTDLSLYMLLFDLAMKEKKEEDINKALEALEGAEGPQGAYHHYGKALYLIWQFKQAPKKAADRRLLEQARNELDRALDQRPSWPPVFLARAEIHLLYSGDVDLAINDLRQATRNGERSPVVIRQLVELLVQKGRIDQADIELKRLRGSLLGQTDLGRLAAVVALRKPDASAAQAEAMIRTAAKSDSEDPRELVWMGRMLAEVDHAEEAEGNFRRAIKLAPEEPDAYIALVNLLARRDRRDEATKVLALAERQLPGKYKSLALGQCLELLGKQARAQEQYQAALEEQPTDAATVRRVASFHIDAGQYRQAEKLLRRLVEGRVEASPPDQAWARRYLAVVLASGTDYARYQEALGLVGLKLDSNGQLVQERDSAPQVGSEEQRFQARVLASQQNHHRFRRRAIELLEALDRDRALTADDRFLLALLYDAEGNWVRSAAIQRELVARISEPRYIAQYAQALLAHNELEQADKWVDKLEELEEQRHVARNAYASLELRARLMEAQGRGEEAVEKLKKHIARRGADPDEILIVLASLARQAGAARGRGEEAVARRLFARAFEMCEEAWERKDRPCRPETAGGMSVALMRAMSPRPSDAQVQRIEEKLKACIAQKPDSVVLLLHLADLHDMRGHYDDAEKSYRAVLRVEPNNVVALNNLAWLLVQRSGNADEALRHINTAVNGIGRRADLLDTRGMVRLAMDNPTEAMADFREATADTPTPTRLYHLARAHFQAHDSTNAARILKDARDQGLTLQSLHPIEQKPCAELFAELKVPFDKRPDRNQ